MFDHIQCLLVHLSLPWLLTSIHAFVVCAKCTRLLRKELWDCLMNISVDIQEPWMVKGDFNVMLNRDERLHGAVLQDGSMEDFAIALSHCGLMDVGFEGNKFTWTNFHMFQRLDSVVYNHHWVAYFYITRIQPLNRDGSDHCPLLISCSNSSLKGHSSFCFIHAWVKHYDFLRFVERI